MNLVWTLRADIFWIVFRMEVRDEGDERGWKYAA